MLKLIEQVPIQPRPSLQSPVNPSGVPPQQPVENEQQKINPEVQKFVDELTKMMDDGTDLGNFQDQLKRYINNPNFFQAATTTGGEDKVSVEKANISVTSLLPTQSEIFLENSVDAGIKNEYGNTPDILRGTKPDAAGSVIVAQIGGNVFHIIDGHHRWSQFVCFNPSSKISCKIIKGMKSPLQGLKVAHLAIAVEKKTVPSESGEANSNLLTMGEKQIFEHIKNKIGSNNTQTRDLQQEKTLNKDKDKSEHQKIFHEKQQPIIDMFRNNIPTSLLPNAKNASLDEIASYITNNTKVVKQNAAAAQQKNPRTIMPQTGNTNFDKDLEAGKVNVQPNPQGRQVASTQYEEPSLNEWLVLAGFQKENV